MDPGTFSGKFLKPAESFAVQHLDPSELNRIPLEIFLGIVALAILGLAVHFVVSTLPLLRKEKDRR
jgi:hypothetical protein